MAWLAQIGLFVMLGLLASPSRLPEALLPALIVGGALLLLARPLSVLLVSTPFRVPLREQAFMSWAGLRGAVPIVLATIPITAGLPGAYYVFDVIFVLVVVFTLIQGPTLPYLARRLGITEEGAAHEVTIESAPLDEVDATMMQLGVPPRSKLAGVYVSELRLPPGSLVSLVVRDGSTFVPDGATALRGGDQLLLVTTNSNRRATERRLRAISRAGRLAGWYGERGDPEPRQTPPPAGRTTLVGPTPGWSAGRDETQTAGTPR
jgi:cell volume regulation protein A